MKNICDKDVIELWLRLYNWLMGYSYVVDDWPDNDSSKPNIDALCRDSKGRTIALEHTLLQPFEIEKQDNQRFMATLGALENEASLLESGFVYHALQSVDSIPTGIAWADVKKAMLDRFQSVLPSLALGSHNVRVDVGDWSCNVTVRKRQDAGDAAGKFQTMRRWPGDPSPDFIIGTLKKKIPKLAAASANMKILLLEKDTAPGTIESQLEKVLHLQEVKALLESIDPIWSVNTLCLQAEDALFTNQAYPLLPDNETYSSLNVVTNEFWRVSR
jgi:hypothetical protein